MLLHYLVGREPKLPREPTPHCVDLLTFGYLFVARCSKFLAVENGNVNNPWIDKFPTLSDLVQALPRARRME